MEVAKMEKEAKILQLKAEIFPLCLRDIIPPKVDLNLFCSHGFDLHSLKGKKFSFKVFKRCASHLALFLIPFSEEKPNYFLKLYNTRLFKRNRVKAFWENMEKLKSLEILFISPLALWWTSPWKAFLNRAPFYGAILFPYMERGFLAKGDILPPNTQINYPLVQKIVEFLFTLHNKGILLKDSKIYNYYLSPSGELKLFDLDGIRFYCRPLKLKERVRDLIPLAKSLTRLGIKEAKTLVLDLYGALYPPLLKEKF